MAAHIPSILASPDGIKQIENIARWFPAAISDCVCFEVGLADEPPPADFGFLCRQGSTGAAMLAGHARIPLQDELLATSTWTAIRQFCREWATQGSSVQRHVNDLWFDFNVATQSGVPLPAIVLSAGIERETVADVAWLEPVLDQLGVPSGTDVLCELERFRSPAMANGVHLMVTYSGAATTARAVFYGVSVDVLGALVDLGYTGVSEFEPIAREFSQATDIISIGVDIGRPTESRIALECKFKDNLRMDTPRWIRLLDYMISIGCCTPASRDAVLQWHGGSVERLSHRLLPATVLRKISHFEVVRQPGTPLQGRAYLFSVVT